MGTTCPQCKTVRESKVREIERVEGELREIEAAKIIEHRQRIIETAKCKTFADFQALAKQRGYKPGWAYHRWKLRHA